MPVEHHLRGFCCANQTGLLSLHHLLGDVIKVFFFATDSFCSQLLLTVTRSERMLRTVELVVCGTWYHGA